MIISSQQVWTGVLSTIPHYTCSWTAGDAKVTNHAFSQLESLCLFFTSIVRRLLTTQLFTYLVMEGLCHAHFSLFTFCEMIDLPHLGWRPPKWGL